MTVTPRWSARSRCGGSRVPARSVPLLHLGIDCVRDGPIDGPLTPSKFGSHIVIAAIYALLALTIYMSYRQLSYLALEGNSRFNSSRRTPEPSAR